MQRDAKENKESFHARPYYRLFINWLLDLAIEDPFVGGAMFQVFMIGISMLVEGDFRKYEIIGHVGGGSDVWTCNSVRDCC